MQSRKSEKRNRPWFWMFWDIADPFLRNESIDKSRALLFTTTLDRTHHDGKYSVSSTCFLHRQTCMSYANYIHLIESDFHGTKYKQSCAHQICVTYEGCHCHLWNIWSLIHGVSNKSAFGSLDTSAIRFCLRVSIHQGPAAKCHVDRSWAEFCCGSSWKVHSTWQYHTIRGIASYIGLVLSLQ